MFFDDLMSNEYRAFCAGELSFTIERFGGINSISLLDVREHDGKMYPDRFPVPWMQRKAGGSMGHPLYSPAIQFHHDGKLYFPFKAELYPFGFKSDDYSVAADRNSMAFRFSGRKGEKFDITFSAFHMVEGKFDSLKNQLSVIASNIQWLPEELRGENFDSTKPFAEDGVLFERRKPYADGDDIVFEISCTYLDCKYSQFWVVYSPDSLHFREMPNGYIAECTVKNDFVECAFGFGKSLAEAKKNARRTFAENFSAGCGKCISPLDVKIDSLEQSEEFFRLFPGYQRHLLLSETPDEAAIRAAADKFGYFALWDHVYPARDFLLFGEAERTKKLLRYMVKYPWVETCPWITIHLIPSVNEYIAYCDDREFLAECMPYFKKYFEFNLRFVNPQTGLLATSMNCGVDCSEQVGLNGLFYASCLNGWWFNALRVLENFSRECGDIELAEKCGKLAELVDSNYVNAFFDEKAGYLRSALKNDGSLPDINIFQNTHTLGMDYIQGPYLYRKIAGRLAHYQSTALYHPMGHVALAYDSEVPCEMWKAVHMNQHLGHECKTARFGGNAMEAWRVMRGYLDYFQRYQCAIETFNLSGCDSDQNQLANWQAFSATGAAQALICGVAGWFKHRGGWTWLCGECVKSEITGLDGRSFSVSGEGGFASGISIDGRFICGTLQTPTDVDGGTVAVKCSKDRPEYPVLLWAPDVKVGNIECAGGELKFSVLNTVHAPLKIFLPAEMILKINGKQVEYEFDAAEKTLWYDGMFSAGDIIEIVKA